MGDIYITISMNDYNFIIHHEFKGDESEFLDEFNVDEFNVDDELMELIQNECDYAKWGNLEDFLTDNKIEYDKIWEDGGDYSAKKAYARLVKGKYKVIEIPYYQQAILDTRQDLLERINSEELKTVKDIKQFLAKDIKAIAPFEIKPLRNVSNTQKFIMEE